MCQKLWETLSQEFSRVWSILHQQSKNANIVHMILITTEFLK